MNIETVCEFCRSLPNATEGVQWGNDLLFRIGNKIFAVVCLESSEATLMSFKCTPEEFAELIEREHIIPAPYMARNHWVSLQRFDAVSAAELKRLIRDSYNMVLAKLPKKTQRELAANSATAGK